MTDLIQNIEKLTKAILNLKSGVEIAVKGAVLTEEDFNSNIKWVTGVEDDHTITSTTCPHPEITWKLVKAEMDKLQIEYDAKQYQRDRLTEYPNHNDCIHALLDGGDTLTELQAKRQATKLKFPKS
jgi:hypothetical protein